MSGFFQKTLIYVIILSIGTLSVGFGLSYYAASLSTCIDGFNLNTKFKKSIFNALSPICASLSSPFVNFSIQKFGRRYSITASSGIVAIGWILIVITNPSYNFLAYIGRSITGFGLSGISTINPFYIAELSPTEVRGLYGVMSQLFTALGGTLIYFMGIWLNWWLIAAISIIPPAINIFCCFFIPESPVFQRIESTFKAQQRISLFQKKYLKAWFISLLVVIFQQLLLL